MRFEESRKKVERAAKHINDLNSLLTKIAGPDFYRVSIEKDAQMGTNFLVIDFDIGALGVDAALIVGDVLHNLRSALDILYHACVFACDGVPNTSTKFPVRDTREELEATANGALAQKQISEGIHSLIVGTIKPYQAGNYPLWALHCLNIADKHKLLIPVLQMVRFLDIRLEDEKGRTVHDGTPIYCDNSSRIRLRNADGRTLTIKDKGYASATVIFDLDLPYQVQPILVALSRISEEVSCTIKAFELALD